MTREFRFHGVALEMPCQISEAWTMTKLLVQDKVLPNQSRKGKKLSQSGMSMTIQIFFLELRHGQEERVLRGWVHDDKIGNIKRLSSYAQLVSLMKSPL